MFPELELKEGWVTVFCLLLMVLCVAWAIQAAAWAEGLAVVQGAAVLGGIVGIVLAKSRFPNRTAHLLSLLSGWTWSAYLTARALADAGEFTITVSIVELEARVNQLFYVPFAEGTSADNYVFVLVLCFLIWIMAYFGAWAVFRWQQVWWAVIVCGAALMPNVTYSSANLTVYLLLFLLFALLLVVRSNVAFRVQEWRRAQVGYSPDLVSSFLQAGLVVSIVIILLAWATPEALASRPLQPIWDKIGEPWRKLQDRSASIFQDLNYQNQAPLVSMGDRRMWFGGPVNLTDTPIADVRADSGRYWRVMVFHDYIGNGWVSTDPDTILLKENEQGLAFPELQYRTELSQTITVHREWAVGDALIAAGQPLRTNVPMRAVVSMVTNEEDMVRARDGEVFPPAPGDPSALYSREVLPQGGSYRALSSVSRADEESLRAASTSYPNWVVPRYLQLPESLPQRVRLLAAEITAGAENSYDKAKAIESYLRQIPYSLEIAGPSLGQDGVDYFLFDEQQGYCDYYASAMVVMLRAVGVPARYVRGYIHPDREDGAYQLVESDGHAWPEVFFSGYGWIEFEPTGGRPALVRAATQGTEDEAVDPDRSTMRPLTPPLMDDELNRPLPEDGALASSRLSWQRLRPWAAVALLLGAAGLVAYTFLSLRRRRAALGLSAAEQVYEALVVWVRRLLRVEPLVSQTPNEYAGVVVQHLPLGQEPVERIVSLYVEERFGGKKASPEQTEPEWQKARRALWRRWLEERLHSVQRVWWRIVPPKEWEMPES